MKMILSKLKRIFKQLRGLFPEAVPTGVSAFDAWVEDIRNTYSLPTEDKTSIRYAISTMIINLGATTAYKSKFYFVLAIRASAAKQVAGDCFYKIKMEQMERQKAEQEAAKLKVVSSQESKA